MMRPLKPEELERIRAGNPEAAPEDLERDIHEYEELLSERFAEDPDLQAAPAAVLDLRTSRERRLQELHARLFAFEREE